VKERFYQVLSFWGNHGTRAVAQLVLLKLGISKPKSIETPLQLDNEPEYQSAEIVLQPEIVPAWELISTRFVALSSLRVYSTPTNGQKRVNLVTDSISSGSLFGGVGTAIILAALLAETRGARLRIVTRTERPQPDNVGHVLDAYGIHVADEVEFVFAPENQPHGIDIFENELFITTSWWTTTATMASIPHESILYLLQEDERMFYPFGDDRLRCEQILAKTGIQFVVNTRLLFDHLVETGLSNIASNAIWFEPAFPREIFYPRNSETLNKRTLIFYARPHNPRNLFYLGIEVIEAAIKQGIIDLDEWDIVLMGKNIPGIEFAECHTPNVFENLSWLEYADLIGTVDLGLSLMYTPHPSYPPLDLAASGAVVVTNRFGNKCDLSQYSNNIICAALDRDALVAALAEGVRLATNTELRAANFAANSLGSNWRQAFSAVLSRHGWAA
jgi:hypothetical protein